MPLYPFKVLFGSSLAVLLASCGGGNSGVPTTSATPTIGVAVDGYLKAATATCEAPYPNGGTISKDGTLKYCCK